MGPKHQPIANRFRGPKKRDRLLEALRAQGIAEHSQDIAEAIASRASIKSLRPGQTLIREEATDDDVFLVLAGRLAIRVHGRLIATRSANTHVGEMAAITTDGVRTATVVAETDAAVARLTRKAFLEVATLFPTVVWRELASELAGRLAERAKFVTKPNIRPTIFIGSSKEGLKIARRLAAKLKSPDREIVLWTKDVFQLSHSTTEDLVARIPRVDFSLLLLTKDDELKIRGQTVAAPRDNLIFELGLSMGALGRDRTWIAQPAKVKLHLPSDLDGLTTMRYRAKPTSTDLKNMAGRIGRLMKKAGPK